MTSPDSVIKQAALEAEVAELRAMRDRVRALADKIARWPTTRTSHGVVAEAITKALDGAGEQQ